MTRGAMRRLLRRRINDVSENNPFFTDAELNEALDLGAAKVQKAIISLDPTAIIDYSRQNIVANENMYPKPIGNWGILDVKVLDTTTGRYTTLGDPISAEDADKLDVTGNTTFRYAHVGRWIQLTPTPDENRTLGLEWRFIGGATIVSGEDQDGQVYPFPTSTHNAIMLWSQVLLTPEFEQGVNMEEIRKQITEELADLPLYYRRTVGREVPFQPDIVKLGSR